MPFLPSGINRLPSYRFYSRPTIGKSFGPYWVKAFFMKKIGKGDKLDKYRNYLMSGYQPDPENPDLVDKKCPLKPLELEMLSRYRRSNALMSMGYSKLQTITLLIRELNISEPQAYAILRDSIQLYGDVNKVDKEGMRYIFYENYMLAASLARKKEDYNAMNRALDSASEILDLKNHQADLIDPNKFLRPSIIMFSTDPNVLKQMQQEENPETYDVDHEEA